MKYAVNESSANQGERSISGKQGGFTLIELMVVITVVGALMALLIPNIMNPSQKTDAMLLERISSSAWSSYSMMTMSCGETRKVRNNRLIDSSVEALIFKGEHNSDKDECYKASGVTPNSSDATSDTSGGSEVFRADGKFEVTIQDSADGTKGARAFEMEYKDVTKVTALSWAEQFRDDLGSGKNLETDTEVSSSTNQRLPISITCGGTNDDVCDVTRRFIW